MKNTIKKNQNYLLFSGVLFCFFASLAFWLPLLAVWLVRFVGLDSMKTGVVFSCNATVCLMLHPFYGYIQDKLGLKKHLLWFLGISLVFVGPFMIFLYKPLLQKNLLLGALVGAIYFGSTYLAGMGAFESYVERRGNAEKFEFGRARMWGSLGWALATWLGGRLINVNPHLNFCLASVAALLLLAFLGLVRPRPEQEQALAFVPPVTFKEVLGLLRLPSFRAFGLYMIGCGSMIFIYDQQFPVYFASFFGDPQTGYAMFGTLNSLQVFIEAGCMFFVPLAVSFLGPKKTLLLAASLTALRIGLSGLATQTWQVGGLKLIQALEFPLLLVGSFKYFDRVFDPRLASTLYLFGFQFMIQLSAIGISSLAGWGYRTLGFGRTYMLLGCFMGVIMVISAFTLTGERYFPQSPNRRLNPRS